MSKSVTKSKRGNDLGELYTPKQVSGLIDGFFAKASENKVNEIRAELDKEIQVIKANQERDLAIIQKQAEVESGLIDKQDKRVDKNFWQDIILRAFFSAIVILIKVPFPKIDNSVIGIALGLIIGNGLPKPEFRDKGKK